MQVSSVPTRAPGAPAISRRDALFQWAIAVLVLLTWVVAVRGSGLGVWIERSLGPWSIVAAVALQGVPALLVVAVLLGRFREPWSAIGLGRPRALSALGRGLLTAVACYAVQPLVVNAYLLASGDSAADIASQKLGWLGAFAQLPGAAMFPIALFVGVYEEILFRGFLQSRLLIAAPSSWASTSRAAVAVIVSALIFGAGHGYQGVLGVLQTTTLGLVLGVSAVLTQSIWPAIVAHVAIDTIGLLSAKYLAPQLEEMLGRAVGQ